MLDYIRIACAVPAVQVGNPMENACAICKMMESADEENCDVVLFPELALTGYTCGDLFFDHSLLVGVQRAVEKVVRCSEAHPLLTVAVGAPLLIQDHLYNCALVVSGGKVQGVVPKTYLPNDRVFQERRWFSGAGDLRCDNISGGELGLPWHACVPVGNDLLFRLADGTVMAVDLCEDLFAPVSPSSRLAERGANLLLNLSASPAAVGKCEKCRQLVSGQSDVCNAVYAYASAGYMESTQDLVFTGQCIVAEAGTVLYESRNGLSAEDLLICDADMGKIRAIRQRNQAVFNGNACGFDVRTVDCEQDSLRGDGTLYPVNTLPFLPEGDPSESAYSIFQMQSIALARRLKQLNTKAVIGVSGGLDSTLALLVSTEACRILGRPCTDVVGITMPCFGTTDRTHRNALELMRILGVTIEQIDIKKAVIGHFADIGQDPDKYDATYENSQARERTQVLMDYAGRIGGIVVGTGDMSEIALGWCTYNGDHMSMFSINGGVPKTVIPYVIRSVMENAFYSEAASILQDVIDTPISPELLPPDDSGNIAQQTEDLVGPYELHDFFLYYMLHYGFSPMKIYTMACRAFAGRYAPAIVKKWLIVFYKRFFTQQFKRSCMPEGVQVFSVGLSPRGGWCMPSDAIASLWIQEAESL